MRKVTGSLLAAVALVALPHMVLAQRRAAGGGGGGGARNEFGVDLGAAFGHIGSGCAANCGTFEAGTPVDVRIGFNGATMSVEPRVTFSYVSRGGGHVMIFSPDVNFLKPMGTSTSHKGLYLTAGAGISFISASGASSENQFSLNGGVGTRIPKPNTNWRLEGFFRYNVHSGVLPSGYNVGVRAGMSFWQ
jgi:hypothetical protein